MIMFDKKQQQILDSFFKEETTWFPNHVLNNFLACILIGISSIILLAPFDIWNDKDTTIYLGVCVLYLTGVSIYANKFQTYNEREKPESLHKILRWMPVSSLQLKLYMMKKIVKLSAGLTMISVIIKLVIAVIRHKFLLIDLIVTIVVYFIFPVISNGITLLWHEK